MFVTWTCRRCCIVLRGGWERGNGGGKEQKRAEDANFDVSHFARWLVARRVPRSFDIRERAWMMDTAGFCQVRHISFLFYWTLNNLICMLISTTNFAINACNIKTKLLKWYTYKYICGGLWTKYTKSLFFIVSPVQLYTIERYYMGCKIQNFKSKIQLAILFIANFPFTVWLLPVAKLSPKFIGGCENGQIMLAIQWNGKTRCCCKLDAQNRM